MLYIDPIVSEWIETERMLCMPLFSSGVGMHVLTRLYADRVGIDLDTVSVPEYIDAIQDWKTRFRMAFDRAGGTDTKGGATTPAPKHTDHGAPLYLEGYIDKLLRAGIITLDNYHLCLQMPICAFYAGVWGTIRAREEIYERQGDLMAEIANLFGNGKKKFKSSDFYNTSHTEPAKMSTEEVYQTFLEGWGLDTESR